MRPTRRQLAAVWRWAIGACLAAMLIGPRAAAADGPEAAALAADGRALMQVVVGEQASEAVQATAATLAAYLSRISGADFQVATGDGATGIVLGLPADFAALPVQTAFKTGPYDREDYVLRSSPRGVWLLGATEMAVEHAAWDLLYRLGHRQYFPGETWEIVPRQPTLAIAVDVAERPDYYSRRIWYNWGFWGYNREPYADWCRRNRHRQGFQLNSGHAYEAIVAANRAAFEAHPEYFSLVDGKRLTTGTTKFCVSNPGLQALVVAYALRRFEAHPEAHSISMDPSDGGNWCECEPCAAIGTPSDRALTLANLVAAAINDLGIGDRYVGMYAYNEHGAPPNIAVHPHVIISATTAFIRGGLTLDAIITGWQEKGATVGIYDYYSVIAWDWNQPGAAKAARPAALAAAIVDFHGKGARFYDCEAGDAWGPYGLGYYIAARTMWDIDEAQNVDALIDDFLVQAFGPAKEPMAAFYHLINVDQTRRSAADRQGRMYRHLAAARELAAGRADVLRRIDDLILYTRYVELYNRQASTGNAKMRDEMIAFAYRIRQTMMIHAYGIWARTVSQAAAADPKHPLKNDAPVTEAEILAILAAGIAANEPVELDFEPVSFSQDYVPATPLKLADVPLGAFPRLPQDRHSYYIWVDDAPRDITLQVTVKKVWNLRPHTITLYSPKEVDVKPVATSTEVKPDGSTYTVTLPTPFEGLHRVEIVDGGDHTRVVWPEGMPVMMPSAIDSRDATTHFRGQWTLYCYVPKGTKVVAGWAGRIAAWAPRISGTLRDGDGNVRLDFATLEAGWFSVPVPEGQDGRLWKFDQTQGTRLLMTIPPCLARSADELLLPRDVVEADTPAP